MSYTYTLTDFFRIKYDEKKYPWPYKCNEDRTIKILKTDVLTIDSETEDGIYSMTKHTGLMCINILIPEDDLEKVHEVVELGVNI